MAKKRYIARMDVRRWARQVLELERTPEGIADHRSAEQTTFDDTKVRRKEVRGKIDHRQAVMMKMIELCGALRMVKGNLFTLIFL